jgi:hypothetical protein
MVSSMMITTMTLCERKHRNIDVKSRLQKSRLLCAVEHGYCGLHAMACGREDEHENERSADSCSILLSYKSLVRLQEELVHVALHA